MRERVRQAAREMRDKIREAARNVRDRSHDQAGGTTQSTTGSTTQSNTQSDTEKPAFDTRSARFTPGATEKLSRDDAILEILAAVKDGRLEPDEADDLINAWMEVSGSMDAPR
jgi:hypothetical protein